MKHASRMKFLKALIALGLFLGAANTAKPQDTLPPNTVLGRTGISAGPAQAIPFATLAQNLGIITGSVGLVVGTTLVNGPSNGLLYDNNGTLGSGPVLGLVVPPTGNGQWSIGATAVLGAVVVGQGSADDFCLENSIGNNVLCNPTGTSHLAPGAGNVPTNNACTGFALGTGSTDIAGRVTFTSATSCAINFGHSFTNAPFCVVSPGSAASTHFVTTTTGVLTATFGTAQTSMMYQCFGG